MSIEMRGSDARITTEDARVLDAYQEVWRRCGRLERMSYRGVPILKHPVDLFSYQQIIFQTRPDIIIETGTAWGGSALFMADCCELFGHGRVLTIDSSPVRGDAPVHPRLTYLQGHSTATETLEAVWKWAEGQTGLIVLDSEHAYAHVLAEMQRYEVFVLPGDYMIVEDTNINGHPIYAAHGPGPWEAVEEFLATTTKWVIDDDREYLGSYNPSGYLRRLA